MSKYIDADELKKRIREGWINGISTVINTMPAADVAPIIHAKWESRTVSVDKWRELWEKHYFCTNCHNDGGVCETDYCPHCGAKMDLESEEHDDS